MENVSFLEILKGYFSKLSKKDVLLGYNRSFDIPLEWIFTEKIDREIIQKLIVSIFERNTDHYRRNAIYKGNNPDVIDKLNIGINEKTGEASIFIKGADKWSKLLITENKKEDVNIPQITQEDFIKEITKLLNEERKNNFADLDLNLSEDAMKYVQSAFAEALNAPAVNEDTKEAMNKLAYNLIDYYKYLLELRKNSENIYYGKVIKRREDERKFRSKVNAGTVERKSEIYPFAERAKIFQNLKPNSIFVNAGMDSDGRIEEAAYTTFVYKNPRGKEGRLCVCEPLEGTHETRMFFISEKNLGQEAKQEKLAKIIEKYIEMSSEEFYNEKFTKSFRHNDIESFKERVEYIITGKENEHYRRRGSLYRQYDEQLFAGKSVTKKEIEEIVIKSNPQEIKRIADFLSNKQKSSTKGE